MQALHRLTPLMFISGPQRPPYDIEDPTAMATSFCKGVLARVKLTLILFFTLFTILMLPYSG